MAKLKGLDDKSSMNSMVSGETIKMILFFLIAVFTLTITIFRDNLAPISNDDLYSSDYQAVFLTNGQVYFGDVTDERSDVVILEDIYYLQINKNIQSQDPNEAATEVPDISLIKLGEELHGPEDQMIINKEQVLFIENLKSDSDVVKAIQSN
ncbi:MAG: hypothetical protein Q9M91_00935 [Candidatus Dojkabacteria bacterium]|nr:hypothetical protein [Candidatus Dojkabacteria bacterium]MDQ7020391.1 hypothetical protein [Candidatus Dojkabacteria bacterium]